LFAVLFLGLTFWRGVPTFPDPNQHFSLILARDEVRGNIKLFLIADQVLEVMSPDFEPTAACPSATGWRRI
jgi:hypothetical protein